MLSLSFTFSFIFFSLLLFITVGIILDYTMICKKCNSLSSVILRKKDIYCSTCFITNINHKFRSCIGKSRILSSNENVLICVSGGDASVVLLDLIHNGVSLDSHKKLRINPLFLHLTYSDDNAANIIIQQCQKYKFNVHIVNMSTYFCENFQLLDVNSIPKINHEAQNKFRNMLKNMPPSVYSDFMPNFKRNLYMKCAEQLQCSYIFTADTNSTLAINLLRNLAIGRGSQVQNDIGFLDNRSEKIKIIRPMKDISEEELRYYVDIKRLVPVVYNDKQPNSLHAAISNFVTDLQENFQSTISTICKTADKIGLKEENSDILGGKCALCESDFAKNDLKLTALEATNFSRMVSHSKLQDVECISNNTWILESFDTKEQNQKLMFPLIHKRLCYSCSRNYSELSPCTLPDHIQQLLQN